MTEHERLTRTLGEIGVGLHAPDDEELVKHRNCRERLEGLAHNIPAALDDEAAGLPRFVVAPLPHEDAPA